MSSYDHSSLIPQPYTYIHTYERTYGPPRRQEGSHTRTHTYTHTYKHTYTPQHHSILLARQNLATYVCDHSRGERMRQCTSYGVPNIVAPGIPSKLYHQDPCMTYRDLRTMVVLHRFTHNNRPCLPYKHHFRISAWCYDPQ